MREKSIFLDNKKSPDNLGGLDSIGSDDGF
jgi:hypothetical protein